MLIEEKEICGLIVLDLDKNLKLNDVFHYRLILEQHVTFVLQKNKLIFLRNGMKYSPTYNISNCLSLKIDETR